MVPSRPDAQPRRRPLIAAHRGASALAMENTLPAFQKAIELGADMIEFDVRRCADGELVVWHDRDVGGHAIAAMTLEEIHALPLGFEVATLAATLDLAKGRIALDVELKEEGYEEEVVALVRARFGRDHVVFTSFSRRSVAAIGGQPDRPRSGFILDTAQENEIDFWREWTADHGRPPSVGELVEAARACEASLIAASDGLLGLDGFESAAVAAGFPLMVWTVNDVPTMKRHLDDPHIEAIITDHPDRAIALRDRHLAGRPADP